jgi:hypothetical protein
MASLLSMGTSGCLVGEITEGDALTRHFVRDLSRGTGEVFVALHLSRFPFPLFPLSPIPLLLTAP